MAWWYWGPGWGWRRGWRGGWGRGWGRGWAWWVGPQFIAAAASRGYTYVGPCRSGIGPWAFYLSPSGQLVHAWQIFGSTQWPSRWSVPFPGWAPVMPQISEKSMLEAEREALKRELQEVERRLRELEGGEG